MRLQSETVGSRKPPRAVARGGESALFVRQAHQIVRDLLTPRPAVFWADFLCTAVVAYSSFAVYVTAPDGSIAQAAAFVLSALAFYRAAVFTHEISHRPAGTFRAFHCIWNLLCGMPLLMPSFLYGDHRSHHAHQSYGTPADAEYLLGSGPWRPAAFLLLALIYPVLGWLRFLLLTPLIVAVRHCDRPVWRRLSSLYMMNPKYRREFDRSAASTRRWMQESGCCVWAWCIAAAFWSGAAPPAVALKTYVLTLFWIGLNQVRTLAAHRYGSAGHPRSYLKQVLDSNTFAEGALLPELWAPLGLRYHALHHLIPALPYHAMGTAHRRLMRELPADSPYRKTLQPGLWRALFQAFGSSAIPAARPPLRQFAEPSAEEQVMPQLGAEHRAQ